MADPAVSVLIPTLDRIEYVGAALASVREQTMGEFEVVVVDTGSNQPVPEVVREVVRQDDRFRLITTTGRLQAPEARNLALAEARAPIVAMLDSDDVMARDRLELHVEALEADPSLVMVCGSLMIVDAAGVPMRRPPVDSVRGPGSDAEIRWALPFESPSLASTLTFRTACLRAIGGFDTEYYMCDDYATIRTVLGSGRARRLHTPAVRYRVHPEQMSHTRARVQDVHLLLLRRAIVSERLGRPVPLSVIAALTRSRVAARDDAVSDALELCDELLERFTTATELTPGERDWVTGDVARRRRLIALGAGEG